MPEIHADAERGARELALRLADATRDGTTLAPPGAGVPADATSAYRIQRLVVDQRGGAIGGWKVGAKSPSGPIQCAPLPATGVLSSPAAWTRTGTVGGIELEIGFRFGRVFAPSAQPYADEEVLEAVDRICATIEIVASRWSGWPGVSPLLQLADLQNHAVLVAGPAQRYDAGFPFSSVTARLDLDDVSLHRGAGTNPAGDPRRLLPWLVNHATSHGLAIDVDTVVTTGSYVGLLPLASPAAGFPARVIGQIDGVAPVELTLR
jgi:2-keto-4-pentenoate hydratase